jgi:hypothetical protein
MRSISLKFNGEKEGTVAHDPMGSPGNDENG